MIAHFVPYPPRGGALQRNYNLLREVSREHQVDLITLNQKALLSTREKIEESKSVVSDLCNKLEVFDIPSDKSKIRWYMLLILNIFSSLPYSVWRYKSKPMTRAVQGAIASEHYDAVHVDTVDLAQYVMSLSAPPRLMNHHNVESVVLFRRAKNETNLLKKAYLYLQAVKLRRYEAVVVREFETNAVVSKQDGDALRRISSDVNITLVPNGVDTDYFKPLGTTRKKASVIFVASLDWYPNVDAVRYLIRDIWPKMKASIPDCEMDLIGAPPPRFVLDFARRNSDFKVHGFVEDVRPPIDSASVYIVPIRVGGGTRLKILDAMAMGKAIVSTSIGCEGIDVKDGEHIMIADTPDKFVDRVKTLIQDAQLRQRLERNARERALEMYSWTRIGPELVQAYNFISATQRDSSRQSS